MAGAGADEYGAGDGESGAVTGDEAVCDDRSPPNDAGAIEDRRADRQQGFAEPTADVQDGTPGCEGVGDFLQARDGDRVESEVLPEQSDPSPEINAALIEGLRINEVPLHRLLHTVSHNRTATATLGS